MKTIVVETSPTKNFKTGSQKLFDNGLTTLIKLLLLATVFYGAYQALILLSVGDMYQELVDALKIFETDTTQTTQLKDAFVEFVQGAGITIVLSWVLFGILSLVYTVATMRVYINSARGKDTEVGPAVQFGFERLGVSILFGLYVSVIVLGYIILATMLTALVPILAILIIPLSFVLLIMLVVRLLYSYQLLSDTKKPEVLSIFENSKQLVKISSNALFLYILFAIALSIVASILFGLFAGLFGAGPSNNYSLTTGANDVVYNTVNFVIFAVLGFFLNAGWVEIYNQAKLGLEPAPKVTKKRVKAKAKK